MMKVALCDEDEKYRELGRKYITEYVENSGCPCDVTTFSNRNELIMTGLTMPFDMIFLGINMDVEEEIKAYKSLGQFVKYSYMVFVTPYITNFFDEYKINADRYILKEEEMFKEEIWECMEHFVVEFQYDELKISLDFKEGRREIRIKDIVYIESDQEELIFWLIDHTKGRVVKSIEEMEERLRDQRFFRIHSKYLVNLKYVIHIKDHLAELFTGNDLEISDEKLDEAMEQFICYRGEM